MKSSRSRSLAAGAVPLLVFVFGVAGTSAQTVQHWQMYSSNGLPPLTACLPQPTGPTGLSGYVSACRTALRGDGPWSCRESWDEEHQKPEYLCTDAACDNDYCGVESVEPVTIAVLDVPAPPPQRCEPRKGNPIYPLRGVKQEVVQTGLRLGRLNLRLTYDSAARAPMNADGTRPQTTNLGALGELWSSSLHRRLVRQASDQGALIGRADRPAVGFVWSDAVGYSAAADINDRLGTAGGAYRFVDAAAMSFETFDWPQGKLVRIIWAQGGSAELTYSDSATPATVAPAPGYLILAKDHTGRSLNFEYTASGRVSRIIDAAGQATQLAYDGDGNLTSLTWPDGSVRSFLYELTGLRWALTGVVDERTIRYSTFGYDAEGRAVSTEHAGGVDRYSVSYATPPKLKVTERYDDYYTRQFILRTHEWEAPQGTTVVQPNGASESLGTSNLLGKTFLASQTQPAGSGCAASSSSIGYDANGNAASRDDFNGSRTCYANDLSRNLETARVEGLSTSVACSSYTPAGASLPAGARKASTEWHPDWRLETRTAEPGRITTTVYNGQPDPFNGGAVASCAPGDALLPDGKPIVVVCKRVEQATTDANGAAGFSATLQSGVPARTWNYTYNRWGQVLSEDGPRTDVSDVTTYEYYGDTAADYTIGDLKKVANAAGQTTTYTKYNPHGQVLESVDANGTVTTHTYDLRQRLLSTTVGSQTTTYEYEPTGDLKKVTQPDGSWVAYGYDAARRMTNISDSLGHSIEYTLDNAGNRTKEEVKDPGGVLARQLSRAYDALGRVQQTIGRE